MATAKLIGTTVTDNAGGIPGGYVVAQKFSCDTTGQLSEIHLYSYLASGSVRVAIYSDNGGNVGGLLAESGSTAITKGDWRTVSLGSNVTVTAGSNYWLAAQVQTNYIIGQHSGSGYSRGYKSQSYGAFPASGAGFSYDSIYLVCLQGWGTPVLSPSGISQPVGYGSPKLVLTVKPSSISQPVACGTPSVGLSESVISPQGISAVISYGMPILHYPQTISPLSTVQPVSIGTLSVGIVGIISPQGVCVIISYGWPAILKYVWHVILDGRYVTGTPDVNRAYIIGRDRYGNPVYGTAVNTDEVALVGERLDFQADPAISTTTQSSEVASAVLSKMRLMGKRGVILIPPNCGQELFDVVQIWDFGANQSAVKFRVVGIRFEYNPRQSRYHHKLILGAP